ncbi:MAG: penicillin-binding protein 2 [Microscillaceae bacterium]
MLDNRRWIILGLFVITGFLFLGRLFVIQVMSDSLQRKAEDISVKTIIDYPHRGIILDRNGRELVVNVPVYDLMVVPKLVQMRDTAAFCTLLGIERGTFELQMKKALAFSDQKPSVFIKQIYREELHRLEERLVEFPGFYIHTRTIRHYPHQSLAHVLGYIGEISEASLERDATGYYQLGDYVGITGLEAAYEPELRGRKGFRNVWVDNWGRERGKFQDGAFDTLALAGHNLRATIDLALQQYGESLFQHKKGALVAIEPATGEVLAMISAPGYDPNLLTGRQFQQNFGRLILDEHKPLFNRALRAKYPPGSTFKTVQALIGMQENVINAHSAFGCNKNLVKCHWHPATNLQTSIQHSCNPYYYNVFRRIVYQNKLSFRDSAYFAAKDGNHRVGYQVWKKYLDAFYIGRKTGVDLADELAGNVPDLSLYDERYGPDNWKFSNIYSLGIGQGEMGVTPLQLANVAAIIANRGHFYIPHLVKQIGAEKKIRPEYAQKHQVPIDRAHFDLIIAGMRDAYRMGTVAHYAIDPELELCGKTGTAQNPHGEDHSVFIAFAPRNNPKIAVAVYVENAGFGGNWAAPIAALVIQKYLKGEISRRLQWTEKYVKERRFVLPPATETPPADSTRQKPDSDALRPEKADSLKKSKIALNREER